MTDNTSEPAILAIIPARGDSKGIPRKDLRLLCGKPLVAYSIEAACGLNSDPARGRQEVYLWK